MQSTPCSVRSGASTGQLAAEGPAAYQDVWVAAQAIELHEAGFDALGPIQCRLRAHLQPEHAKPHHACTTPLQTMHSAGALADLPMVPRSRPLSSLRRLTAPRAREMASSRSLQNASSSWARHDHMSR